MAPLCGAGNEPPFSFRQRRKDCARRRVSEPTAAKRRLLGEDKRPFTVKRKGAFVSKSCPFGQVWTGAGVVRDRAAEIWGLVPGALYSWGTEKVLPRI